MADRTKDHPHLLGQDSKERQDLADHVERLEVALRLAQARNQDLEAALGRIREASESHPECDRHLDRDVIKCGWKRAVISMRAALAQARDLRDEAKERERQE